MIWVAVDIVVALGGLLVLALVAVRLWRQVKAFGAQVGAASDRIAAANAERDRLTRR